MKKNLRLFLLFVISYRLFGPAVNSFAQSVSFNAPTNFAVGLTPSSVAVGDFNRDGKQDLAVANINGANVSILLGTGNGSFGLATNFAVGSGPKSVAVGDFNGDANQDLAVVNAGGNSVSILLGNGNGSFGSPINILVGSSPNFVAVGDFNRDGKQDLAVANFNNGNVSVLLGIGNGNFGSATNFAVVAGPTSVAVGDFNRDGKQDLAVANQTSANVSILLGTGNGNFGLATNFAAGSAPTSVAVADFNGDGRQDLAVANQTSANVSILLGTGNGNFGSATNFAAGSAPTSVAVGDFNGDGRQDLAVANFNSANVSILLGTGNGNFGSATNFAVLSSPTSVAVADFSGDGKRDLAVANANSNNVSILLNNSPSIFNGDGQVNFGQLTNISTRGRVLTGDNAMIGGFIIEGSAAKRVVVRSRGPSMGGQPFNVPGTLANPLLRLFSGETMIAQNDNWGDGPSCSEFVCEGAVAITATGFDPCKPNPGQTGPPPGCALESAILITLPPGAYTGIVTGADGGTGVGLVEVFEADTSTLSGLSNISTRAFVQTGDNVMIGGLIIEASEPKTVLIRARGPSMSGAPFFVPGTLVNPIVQLFSGQTVIAFNDNWRDLQQEEIVATGLDPCQPNPGQAVAPPGCDQESAMVLDLPAGGYTAIVRGIGGTTGIGLVEIFEVADVTIPNALGNFVGTASITLSNCQIPANNGIDNFSSMVNVSSQNGSLISATGTFTGPVSVNLNITGTATAGADAMGSFTFTQPGASGSGTFAGLLTGNTLTLNFTGQFTSGETCIVNGSLTGSR